MDGRGGFDEIRHDADANAGGGAGSPVLLWGLGRLIDGFGDVDAIVGGFGNDDFARGEGGGRGADAVVFGGPDERVDLMRRFASGIDVLEFDAGAFGFPRETRSSKAAVSL